MDAAKKRMLINAKGGSPAMACFENIQPSPANTVVSTRIMVALVS